MTKYVIKRILYMIPVLLGVAFLVFTILSLTPGDPGSIILGITAKPEDIAALNAEFGYDKPFLIRFFNYIGDIIFHFSLGTSYQSRGPVMADIMSRFPNTLTLAVLSMAVSSIIGISLGILSAVRQYSVLDHVCVVVALIFASIPGFWFWTDAASPVCVKAWLAAILWSKFIEAFYFTDADRFADFCRRAFASDALGNAGDDPSGVYPHGEGKGRIRKTHHLEACTAQCAPSGCHNAWRRVRCLTWRGDHCGDGICDAGHGHADHDCDPPEGYSDGYGSNVIPGGAVQFRNPAGRCAVCVY